MADDKLSWSEQVEKQANEIPDQVKNFILGFQQAIKDQNIAQITQNYDNNWNKLTDKFYKQTEWPSVDNVAPLVNEDKTFLCFYKELWTRHLFSRLHTHATIEHRFKAWENYGELFNFLINADKGLELDLPNQWIWDIIDEFIYQFQEFCQYRSKLKNKTPEDIAKLKANPQVWSIQGVLKYLQALIDKSNILKTLEKEKQKQSGAQVEDDKSEGFDFASQTLFKMLGYFSIVGLCRVHCMLGDYYMALRVLSPIDFNKKGLYTKVIACYITLYYYMGFAYMMSRRFVDAIKTFSSVLLYISRTRQPHNKSYQHDLIAKKNDQMYTLLAILISFCPQRIDEHVNNVLREKHADNMPRMQKGELKIAEDLMIAACPKYINPSSNIDDDSTRDPMKLQIKIFLNELEQQIKLPTLRSYLKLYTTIGISKLASLLEIKEDDEALRTYLLAFTHKNRNMVSGGGSPSEGKWASSSDIEFYIDKDMIHIVDTKAVRRYGEFFTRQFNKLDEIIADISE
jgi:translation initiation factor 3 subunit L